MLMAQRSIALIAAALFLVCLPAHSQGTQPRKATVYADTLSPVAITDPYISFRFEGSGWYNPSNYPTEAFIPLANGVKVSFDRVAEVTLTSDSGSAPIAVVVTTKAGRKVESTLGGPHAAVYITGTTDLGRYEYKVNPLQRRVIRMTFP